ncbi:MAG TPA: hypothetical protein EYP56_18795 [Planctomycetaceae bacterium]|nr:hypothetical protein [Planctomycetaceae bacterium]HIQ22257.1 hypothetical protein [Planctomycetota bacterium]
MKARIAHPEHLLGAIRLALVQGGRFLLEAMAPHGPILAQPNLSYIHKASWGMYAAGVDHDTIALLLDWAQAKALQQNGDFYFPEEPPEYKDLQRVYRPLTFGKVAVWIGHPVIRESRVLERILQYQHDSGGVFHYIGDNPARIEPPETIGSLNTTFFGQLMLALDDRPRAEAAGQWVLRWVEANGEHLQRGQLYTQMTPDGRLVTEIGPGEAISRRVDNVRPKQEFWQVGTAMAYLADLYEAMHKRWGEPEEKAEPYLEAALRLLEFEATMPLETYLWPSKCKVGWGAAELLRVMIELEVGTEERRETAYQICERVALFTFLDTQLPDGGWAWMHYPLRDDIPEIQYAYKPLKATVRVPPHRLEDSHTIFLPREEVTGEFLGELKAIEEAVAAWLKRAGAETV